MTSTAPVTPASTRPFLVTLPAEIDLFSAHATGEQLAAACAPGGRVVIADMTATTFCDSMGIRMLVQACRAAAAHGTDLRLLVTCPHVIRVIEVLGLDTVLPLYHNLQDALTGPATPPTWPPPATTHSGQRTVPVNPPNRPPATRPY